MPGLGMEEVLKYPKDCDPTPAIKGEAFDVALEIRSNEVRYTAICPCQTRGGVAERQPAR